MSFVANLKTELYKQENIQENDMSFSTYRKTQRVKKFISFIESVKIDALLNKEEQTLIIHAITKLKNLPMYAKTFITKSPDSYIDRIQLNSFVPILNIESVLGIGFQIDKTSLSMYEIWDKKLKSRTLIINIYIRDIYILIK